MLMILRSTFLLALIVAVFSMGCLCADEDDASDEEPGVPLPEDDDSEDDDVPDDDTHDDDTHDDDTFDDDSHDDDLDDDTEPGDPIEADPGFLVRCGEYLQYCFDRNGPGSGGVHGQVCRLALGGEMNQAAIRDYLVRVENREDTTDFGLTSIMRLLLRYPESENLPPELAEEIKAAFLGYKYWPDESGADSMVFWSENHQVLFLQLELLAGQLWPDEVFGDDGLSGRDHVAKAEARLPEWLAWRGRIGFTEWHSNVYYNEDIPALVNLVDFAQNEEIRVLASMVLDLLAFDMALNSYKGFFATAHGRTYPDKVMGRGSDPMASTHWVWFGNGAYNSGGSFSTVALCTSYGYALPPVLARVGADTGEVFVNRQRDGIFVEDGPEYGLSYDDPEDMMFWWSMSAYAAWRVLPGSLQLMEDWNLWEGAFSGALFLRPLVGSPLVAPLARMLDPLTRGPATEEANLYTYRTRDYQLSSVQSYNPGFWGAQQHIWTAIIDAEATVFTTYPGGLPGDYMAGDWTGGWFPRAGQYKNVIVLLYQRPVFPLLEGLLFKSYTHAYFPKDAFDEVLQQGHWTFGKKQDGYVALYSHGDTFWSLEEAASRYELISDGIENVWIVELGRAADDGSFEEFVTRVSAAQVQVEGMTVRYDSPGVGQVEFSMDGELLVEGQAVDLGPYPRFDNPYCRHEWGANPYFIEYEDMRLELDFDRPRRRYFAGEVE